MKRTNGFQLERALAGGQTLPPWAAALCGGLCAAGALTLLAGSFPVLPAWAALLLQLMHDSLSTFPSENQTRSAASMTCFMRTDVVTLPTPPGTGVMASTIGSTSA